MKTPGAPPVDPGMWLESLGSDDGEMLLMLVWVLPLILFVFYGQRIQLHVTSGEIQKSIRELDSLRRGARAELAGYVRSCTGRDEGAALDSHISGFAILPVGIDPAGLVGKMRHVLRSRESATRRSIRSIDGMGGDEAERAQTLLEAASALRSAYMAVNHMFLTAKRHRNYPLILPLQMALPSLMEEARALRAGMSAFRRGQPVGDGIGPLVVGRMMLGLEKSEPAPQTSMASTEIEGRRVVLLKARGPAPTVGRLDDAVCSVFEGRRVDAVVTVDAALRYEGQESAEIEEGFGVAMGGAGTERFAIEEAATKAGVPVRAVVVRQSVREAVTLMTRQIAESAGEARVRVRGAVLLSEPGQTVLVVGVGNTSGVPQ